MRRVNHIVRAATFLLLVLPFTGCSPSLHRFEYTRVTMGVEARIVLYAHDQQQSDAAVNAAYVRLAELDGVLSDYRADSDLNRLCAAPAGKPVRVHPDLFNVLRNGQEVSAASRGAFDITIGPLVELWREARRTGTLPGESQVADARARVGYEHIVLDSTAETVTLQLPAMQLDLGGIAKGYAAEQAVNTLRAHGIASALVALAGDVVVSEAPPGEQGWCIAIDHGSGGAPTKSVVLAHAAVSTSGSNQQFMTIDGTRYSHIIDPRKAHHTAALGLTSPTIVTVISHDGQGGRADALASAACILGSHEGAALIAQFPDCTAIFGADEQPVLTREQAYRGHPAASRASPHRP